MNYRANIVLDRCKLTLPEIQGEVDTIIKNRKITSLLDAYDFKSINTEIFNFRIDITSTASLISLKIRSLLSLYSPYSAKNFSAQNWGTNNICYICDKNHDTWTTRRTSTACNICNIVICKYCLPIYSICNNKKCCNCSSDLDPEYLFSNLPTTFYNKFIKEKKRKLKIEEQEIRENTFPTILSLIKQKLSLSHKLIELAVDILKISGEINTTKQIKDRAVFVKKCPNNDCRGFLSSSWKCGLCEKFFCKDCHKEKNEDHVCDESEKLTISMLKKDTKPCPQCGMPIDRYTGCSQVWTPCCKIAFDWNTGKIDKGRIHSPEYYDFLRRTEGFVPREREDNICGGDVDMYALHRAIKNKNQKRVDRCMSHHRQFMHVVHYIIPLLPTTPDSFEKNDLGIKYMLKEIDETKWQFELKKRIKKSEKNHHILNILSMYRNVMNDLFKNLIEDNKSTIFIDNANKLTKYTNEHIAKIQKRYKSSDKSFYLVEI